ncbi:hypothetical protein IW261DRAFT_1574489 [Armillaria novae-zelandiae]|uniref:Extracellular metalloproteinase n=1 Tax=Armillaria novae-zelandiae TaxID=153914 RepID=A0AA39U400_9AGAR|nr:hypothetical protein IW261DRAFT_1574489 [Armillaria novae-zelandiae]
MVLIPEHSLKLAVAPKEAFSKYVSITIDLRTIEASGIGEGWLDGMAEWTEQKSGNITDFVTGTWVVDNPAGVRTHPYSTDPSVNPFRYSSLVTLQEIHGKRFPSNRDAYLDVGLAIGEVWVNILVIPLVSPGFSVLIIYPFRKWWLHGTHRFKQTWIAITALTSAFFGRLLRAGWEYAANYEDDGTVPDGY